MNTVFRLNEAPPNLTINAVKLVEPERFRPELLSYCRKLTRSSWDAEDLTQETLLKSLDQVASHKNPKAYLFRIAKNAWIDQCRKQKEEMELNEQQVHGKCDKDLVLITDTLSLLIKKLSPLQCVIFLLRDVWSFSAQEVAECIGTTEGAVKSALHRARRNLLSYKNKDIEQELLNENEVTEQQKVLLKTLVTAFINEDMEALLVLAQNDVIHPIHALRSIREFEGQFNKTPASGSLMMLAMAA
ncbi:MAG TPA: RNA polymerase sigma factor [Sporolactobacillaceae bacterium]|nr:RNA polymerase sigma factor [Sporolactobacillaceae bacterium]